MNKSEIFDENLQELARFARAIAHPAQLAILQYLAETKSFISGDISQNLPLSRTTVSQHLCELKEMGLIHGEIEGLRINYCICSGNIHKYLAQFDAFFGEVKDAAVDCETKTLKR